MTSELDAHREIAANVRYILEQLPSMQLPENARLGIERVCDGFRDALCGITPMPLDALDRLVRSLDEDPELALASVLVTESAANILRAHAALPAARATIADRVYACSACGAPAGRVRLFEDGGLERASFTSLMGGGGPLDPETFARLRTIVEAGDLEGLYRYDLEVASFYCPECPAAYCRAHWDRWDVFDEDGWHDSIRGRCPKGHERMLED